MKRFSLGTWAITLSLLACIIVTGCERVQSAPEAGSNIEVPAFEWRVRDADTLAKQYAAAGKDAGEGRAPAGFIARDLETGRIVVYTLPPRYVDDTVARTLGHEVMHAALGDYHAKREAR